MIDTERYFLSIMMIGTFGMPCITINQAVFLDDKINEDIK